MPLGLLGIQAVGFLAQTVPVIIFFWNQIPEVFMKKTYEYCLKRSFQFLAVLLAGFLAVTFVCYHIRLDSYQIWADLYMMIAILIFALFFRSLLEIEWYKLLIPFLLGIQFEAVIVAINATVMTGVPDPVPLYTPYYTMNIILLLTADVFLLPLACLAARKMVRCNLAFIQGKTLKRGYIYVVLSVLVYILVSVALVPEMMINKLVYLLSILFCNLLTYFVYFSEVTLGKRQAQTEGQMYMANARYQMIQENIELTRRMRHDMRHQINALRAMYVRQDWKTMGEFLEESGKQLKELEDQAIVRGNLFLDTLLDYYYESAVKNGIRVEKDISVIHNFPFPVTDLTTLVGNCMENAIEACAEVPAQKRFIRVRVKERGPWLLFQVENSCRFDPSQNGAFHRWVNFLSGKRNGEYGIGLKSMDAVVEKYQGTLLCRREQEVFTVRFAIQAPAGGES